MNGERGYHPLRATLDHVWPVSKLGEHEPANVKIAHSICNSIKGEHRLTELIVGKCKEAVATLQGHGNPCVAA